MNPFFLDTTIFLYAAGAEHPLQQPCRAVLEAAAAGTLVVTTNAEVVQEILHVLIRRGQRVKGIALARNVLALCPELLPLTGAVMRKACEILEAADVAPRDAVHAASMLEAGVTSIVTPDRDFERISMVSRLDPVKLF